MSSLSLGVPPDELVRRISEIDLTKRRRTDTITSETSPATLSPGATIRYSRDELFRLAPDGVATPKLPNPPPSTPIELPATPPSDDQLALTAAQAQQAVPAKKKKKKTSGKNKKLAPTGFEGMSH